MQYIPYILKSLDDFGLLPSPHKHTHTQKCYGSYRIDAWFVNFSLKIYRKCVKKCFFFLCKLHFHAFYFKYVLVQCITDNFIVWFQGKLYGLSYGFKSDLMVSYKQSYDLWDSRVGKSAIRPSLKKCLFAVQWLSG